MGFAPTVTGDARVVSLEDDAVDWSKTPRLEYAERRDPAILVLRDGRTPFEFTVRSLRKAQVHRLAGLPAGEREFYAFLAGVADFSASAEFGLRWEGDGSERRIKIDSVERIPSSIIREIGAWVISRASLSEGESRGCAR